MDILRAVKITQTVPRHLFADLVDMYSDSVYKLCRALTYSTEDADDLFQETFLKVFEQLPKLSTMDNPQRFLFSTALYLWKSWKRKYARRNRLVPVGPLAENMASDVRIEDSFMEQEETRIVRQLVEALPEKYRVPVTMYYTLEMGVPEIASTLKLPMGTVKSRLFKARKLVEKGLIAVDHEK